MRPSVASFVYCTFSLIFIRRSTTGQKLYKGGPEAVLFNTNVDFQNCIETAPDLLKRGDVIIIPTDTVYGIACDAENTTAIEEMYKVKGRANTKPLSICVHDVRAMGQWGQIAHLPTALLNELLPGPVTVVVDRTSELNSELNPNESKIGIRIPKHKFVEAVTAEFKRPIALTSANKSGGESTIAIKEFEDLWHIVDSVFSGGTLGPSRAGSTIIDLSIEGQYRIIRDGCCLHDTLLVLKRYGLTEA